MDPESIRIWEVVTVVAIAVTIPVISLLLVKRLKLKSRVLEWTLAMGIVGLVVGFKAPYFSFILQMTGYGLAVGFVIGVVVSGLDWLTRRDQASPR